MARRERRPGPAVHARMLHVQGRPRNRQAAVRLRRSGAGPLQARVLVALRPRRREQAHRGAPPGPAADRLGPVRHHRLLLQRHLAGPGRHAARPRHVGGGARPVAELLAHQPIATAALRARRAPLPRGPLQPAAGLGRRLRRLPLGRAARATVRDDGAHGVGHAAAHQCRDAAVLGDPLPRIVRGRRGVPRGPGPHGGRRQREPAAGAAPRGRRHRLGALGRLGAARVRRLLDSLGIVWPAALRGPPRLQLRRGPRALRPLPGLAGRRRLAAPRCRARGLRRSTRSCQVCAVPGPLRLLGATASLPLAQRRRQAGRRGGRRLTRPSMHACMHSWSRCTAP
mmetsp:Transcript_140514/g.436943  ORF Transcript_140514/g.436943 Transcript_140514/m.436943 type:complete len:340 (+) Transcript_140514:418-1437(+)